MMKLAEGCSLKDFVVRNKLDLMTTIRLIKNLIRIVEHVHENNVLHQNLSPNNVIIEWTSTSDHIDQASITLTNFSKAEIKSNEFDVSDLPAVHQWYHARQSNKRWLRETVDASGICAILFWLLTGLDPCSGDDLLPHEKSQADVEIDRQISLISKSLV
jgi:serine/threonine protein kinase